MMPSLPWHASTGDNLSSGSAPHLKPRRVVQSGLLFESKGEVSALKLDFKKMLPDFKIIHILKGRNRSK